MGQGSGGSIHRGGPEFQRELLGFMVIFSSLEGGTKVVEPVHANSCAFVGKKNK